MPIPEALMILAGGVFFAIILTLYLGFRVANSVGAVRRESKRGADLAKQLRHEWGEYERKQSADREEATRKIEQRVGDAEHKLDDTLGAFEEQVTAVRNNLTRLEDYLRDFFEVEVKNAFDSFDSTVTDVLDQMKGELLRGIDRINDIQTVVSSKTAAENRLLEGQSAVYRITDDDSQPVPGTVSPDADAPSEADTTEEEALESQDSAESS